MGLSWKIKGGSKTAGALQQSLIFDARYSFPNQFG